MGRGVPRKQIPYSVKLDVIRRDGPACRYCGISLRYGLMQVDHIVPKALGGWDEMDNLQLLCQQCNKWKGAQSNPTTVAVARHVGQLREARAAKEAHEDMKRGVVAPGASYEVAGKDVRATKDFTKIVR